MKICPRPSAAATQLFPAVSDEILPREALNAENIAVTPVESLYQHLDLQELFQQVSQILKDTYAIDGFDFNSSIGPYDYQSNPQTGNNGYFGLSVEVNHQAQKLGSMLLFRRRGFSTHEASSVKKILRSIGGPLSNALQYATACHTACHDSLTGLYNRAALNSMLFSEHSALLESSRFSDNQLVLMVCDVDRFKLINDTCGHVTGDEVLRQFATQLKSIISDDSVIFRYGGDEFVVVLSNQTLTDAQKTAEKVRRHIEQSNYMIDSIPIKLTTTIGVTPHYENEPLENAFMRADSALMQGKKLGKNQVVWWNKSSVN